MIYQYKNMKMHYEPHLDGGGRESYPEFLRIIQENIGKVETVHEFCAGPGFIGFSLFEDRMCDKLVLSDISKEAIDCCRKTIKDNNLWNVSTYVSDCLKQIPFQKWDLVVGNPPHFSERQYNLPQSPIINVDSDWQIHNNFYMDIMKYLRKDGSVLFLENGRGSNPETFAEVLQRGGMDIAGIFPCVLNRPSKHYFIWSKIK